MNHPPLFDACVPVLLRYLASLDRIVRAVEALPQEQHASVLQAQLAPDMLPLYRQLETATYFALRTAYPLAGLAVPRYVAVQPSTAALRENITNTIRLMAAMSASQFENAHSRSICEKAGNTAIELPAQEFLAEFALPNFFFHVSMAYAIARMSGCAVGKADYDGFHVY